MKIRIEEGDAHVNVDGADAGDHKAGSVIEGKVIEVRELGVGSDAPVNDPNHPSGD